MLPVSVLCQRYLWAACIILGPVTCSRCNELLPLARLKDASRLQAKGVRRWVGTKPEPAMLLAEPWQLGLFGTHSCRWAAQLPPPAKICPAP